MGGKWISMWKWWCQRHLWTLKKCLNMASSHSAYFSSCAAPCGAYASSELSLKSVAVMSLEQLCGALSNITNEPLWRPTIVLGLSLCCLTLIARGCSAVVGVAHQHRSSSFNFGPERGGWGGGAGKQVINTCDKTPHPWNKIKQKLPFICI